MVDYLCSDPENMAKKKLVHQPDLSDIFLVGISTDLADYRLAYFLNRDLLLKLERLDDLPVFNEKTSANRNYCLYHHFNIDCRLHYYLLGNNSHQGKMVDQYPQADYFLMLKGNQDDQRNQEILTALRKLNVISFVFVAVKTKVKELDGIIYDLELHQMSLNPRPLRSNFSNMLSRVQLLFA